VGGLSAFIGYRVYGVGKGDRAQIHQLFLLHKSGLLIKHYSRSLRGDLDSDILAAMIVAVQNFVRETFRFGPGDLEEMKYGTHKILLVHGQNAILAALVSGHYLDRMKSVLRQSVARIEEEYAPQLRDWTGMMSDLRGIDGRLDQVLQGRVPYANGRNGNGRTHSPP
jgi:OOP family OmpA-OmpF porin